MWYMLLRDSNMTELVLGKKKELIRRSVVEEIHSVKGKNPAGGGGMSVASTSPLKFSVTPRRIRLPANSLTETSCP